MKHLSKALIVLSVLGLASAAHAQTSYFGTTFDSTTTYPYTDGTIYTAGGAELGGQGGFTASAPGFAQVFGTGGGTNFGTLSSGSPAVTLSHALSQPTVGGFNFQADFSIANTGGLGAPGNAYAFNFNTGGTTIFSINFAPTGADATPVPQLVIGGVVLDTAAQGPVIDQFFHLTVQVSNTGAITATLGVPNSELDAPVPVPAAATGINGISISETTVGGGGDFVQFDNLAVVVPEPSTYVTMGLGLLGMLGLMKFRRLKA